MSLRTICLKIYKPGKRKQEIMEEAMRNYSMACQYLLFKAKQDIESITEQYTGKNGLYNALALSKWVDKELSKEINRFGVQPFKDSLKLDFGMILAGYLNARAVKPDTRYPAVYWREGWLRRGDCSLPEGEEKAPVLRPLYFCRYDTKRDYCLLYDAEKNRYYAKLYLMNAKSEKRLSPGVRPDERLQYIHRDKDFYKGDAGSVRYIIVPLAFGQWQEEYLKSVWKDPSVLKTARLVKQKNEYYLSINMDIGEADKIKRTTFIGLTRGLRSTLNYTVVNDEGVILANSSITGIFPDHTGSIPVSRLHRTANEVVKIAFKYKSQVIVEELIDKSDKLGWTEGDLSYKPLLASKDYNQLVRILEYKLEGRGLPPLVRVSPVGLFYTCPVCGLHSKRNRLAVDIFICTACGTTFDIEKLGSCNAARKLLLYSISSMKVKVLRSSDGKLRFVNRAMGLDFSPNNDIDCVHEVKQEIRRIFQERNTQSKGTVPRRDRKKVFSAVKKLEKGDEFITFYHT